MQLPFAPPSTTSAIPITFVSKSSCATVLAAQPTLVQHLATANAFTGKPGQLLIVPDASGAISGVLFGLDEPDAKNADPFRAGQLPSLLQPGTYRFANKANDPRLLALGFALGSYRFQKYRKEEPTEVRLVPPEGADACELARITEAAYLARDLINTPANDMGPQELADAAYQVAARYRARFDVVVGDALLTANFPLIHAVGKASSRAPRLIDFTWGNPAHPKVTLVGKGVCFDTGGLDLKPSGAMLIMKKDMGGAANVLALAQMIMDAGLKLRLRVLIPAVENAVAGNAFRPLDIYPSRKGPTIEIGNTDAEGRLVLADALALADEEAPELLIDMGTLTGAARVALGPDLPPFYTNDEALAADVARWAIAERDPLWRLPLWPAYDSWLDAKAADINNAPNNTFAGSITCALFLQRFVEHTKAWLHLDIYGWTPSAKPGRPEGGECQGARALFKLLGERYG